MKVLIGLIAIVAIAFGSTYFIHSNNVEEVSVNLQQREDENSEAFEEIKQAAYKDLSEQDAEFAEKFNEIFDISVCTKTRDTAVNLFVYGDVLSYDILDLDYVDCVKLKAKNEVINTRVERTIDQKLDSINEVLGGTEEYWINRMKYEKKRFWEKDDYQCIKYFEENYRRIIKPKAFDDLMVLIGKYREDEKIALAKSQENDRVYNAKYNSALRKLNAEGRRIFEERINTRTNVQGMKFYFSSDYLGDLDYSFKINNYSISDIEQNLDYALEKQYTKNSLSNGSMPYGYCYGTSNYGSSGVRVNAGGGDVLVMVKNMSDRVIRHAYIKANRSYTLNIPDGSYRVFFYHGSGWNPHKFMKNTTCGELTGGFINNEAVTKDPSTLTLYSQIMSYTLTQVVNGNFNTAGSSKNEAF